MAKLPGKFNADDHDEMGNFDAVPVGKYHVKVKKSELKDTKAKIDAKKKGQEIKGSVLGFSFEVVSGEYKGRLLFTNLNIENENAQTVEIAEKELTSIAIACGKKIFDDTDELNGREMLVTVKIEPATAQYPAKNKITKYEPAKGVAVPGRSSGAGADPAKKKKKKRVTFT